MDCWIVRKQAEYTRLAIHSALLANWAVFDGIGCGMGRSGPLKVDGTLLVNTHF